MANDNDIKQLIKRRHNLIPGGAHTYSKGDDQFPSNAPKVIIRGRGAYVWDENGNKYLDWCMGLRSVSLGHVNQKINKAVIRQINDGTNFGRPHISEFELADLLVKLLPNVEMVRFAKNGSSITTAAVKLARAFTGRKYVAYCSDHAFFSHDDWFIGTTPCNSGVPKQISNLSIPFRYNDIKSLEGLFKKYKDEIACVIMETVTTERPRDNFLKKVQSLCRKNGAIFIIDEMITGFRFSLLGAAHLYGLEPDLVTYGKGIANGYSVAVLGGRKDIMELGGLYHKKPRVFLISSTHSAETIGLRAAIETIKFTKDSKVPSHFWKMGSKLKNDLEDIIKRAGLSKYISVIGFEPNLSMSFKDKSGNNSLVLKTIFLQEVVRRGILFQGYFAISYSHKQREVSKTVDVFGKAFDVYKKALESGNYSKFLQGDPVRPVFRKFN